MASRDSILKAPLALSAGERAEIIDELLPSLNESDREIDTLWVKEGNAGLISLYSLYRVCGVGKKVI